MVFHTWQRLDVLVAMRAKRIFRLDEADMPEECVDSRSLHRQISATVLLDPK